MKSNNLASDRYLDHSKRYDQEQGFSEEQQCDQVIIPKQQAQIQLFHATMNKPKAQIRYHQPRLKLTLLNPQKNNQQSIKEKLHMRQSYNTPKKHFMSLEMKKKNTKNQTTSMNSFESLIKSKRTMIGDNIQSKDYCQIQIKALKNYVTNTGGQLCYEKKFQSNTHAQLKSLIQQFKKLSNQDNFFFLKSKYNANLRQKLNTSFIVPKKSQKNVDNSPQSLQFSGQFECGNLQFTAKIDEDQYDIYMSIDTNTRGHQNWFYFRVRNNSSQIKAATFNVCNLKRQFAMFNKGVKVFIKKLDGEDKGDFRGSKIKIGRDSSPLARGYKLSFTYQLQPQSWYQMSLIPPLTYSTLLKEIQQKQHHPNFSVDIMTYSLAGLAIPIITIGKEVGDKNIILISGRIHPGETVGSFVVRGVIEKFLQQAQFKDFFDNNVIKVVPMINPDGVIFGNFRTNYLGTDLNRAFNTNDEILYPEIFALKQYARELKQKYKNKFIMFLDIHGHSSKKNIFSYGPDYQIGNPNFYISRLFPKVIHSKSKYFKYNHCSFKLQQYKKNTARGFFLNELGVISYTIQTSYGLYDDYDKQYTFKINDWLDFGAHLAQSLAFTIKLLNIGTYKTHNQIKRMISQSEKQQIILIKKINKDIKKEQLTKKQKPQQQTRQSNSRQINSDAESSQEDLNQLERSQLQKKVAQTSLPQFMLPRMYKPTILYPTGTPRLLQFNDKQQHQFNANIKILYPKRLKYNALRSMNISSTSTTLSRQIQRLQILKPYARNIKLEKRVQF